MPSNRNFTQKNRVVIWTLCETHMRNFEKKKNTQKNNNKTPTKTYNKMWKKKTHLEKHSKKKKTDQKPRKTNQWKTKKHVKTKRRKKKKKNSNVEKNAWKNIEIIWKNISKNSQKKEQSKSQHKREKLSSLKKTNEKTSKNCAKTNFVKKRQNMKNQLRKTLNNTENLNKLWQALEKKKTTKSEHLRTLLNTFWTTPLDATCWIIVSLSISIILAKSVETLTLLTCCTDVRTQVDMTSPEWLWSRENVAGVRATLFWLFPFLMTVLLKCASVISNLSRRRVLNDFLAETIPFLLQSLSSPTGATPSPTRSLLIPDIGLCFDFIRHRCWHHWARPAASVVWGLLVGVLWRDLYWPLPQHFARTSTQLTLHVDTFTVVDCCSHGSSSARKTSERGSSEVFSWFLSPRLTMNCHHLLLASHARDIHPWPTSEAKQHVVAETDRTGPPTALSNDFFPFSFSRFHFTQSERSTHTCLAAVKNVRSWVSQTLTALWQERHTS